MTYADGIKLGHRDIRKVCCGVETKTETATRQGARQSNPYGSFLGQESNDQARTRSADGPVS